MSFSSRTFTSTLVLGATLALPSLAQDEKPQAIRAPGEPVVDPNHREPDEMEGERVTESTFWIESMEEVMEREAREGPVQPLNHRLRNGRDGEWEVAGTRTSHFPHSGIHYVFNKWGDTRMGIGFRREVNLSGAWMVRFGNNGAVARGVQIVGFRNGQEVARTDWFRDLDEVPDFFAMNLDRVDRIEFVAEAAVGEAGWFGMDDLTFTDLSTGLEEIIDFEDLNHEDSLTGSGYAGLVWESGSGFSTEVDLTSVPPPMEDATAGTGGGSNKDCRDLEEKNHKKGKKAAKKEKKLAKKAVGVYPQYMGDDAAKVLKAATDVDPETRKWINSFIKERFGVDVS